MCCLLLSEIVVMAYSDESTQGGTYIIEEKLGKNLSCSVAHALVEPRNGKVSTYKITESQNLSSFDPKACTNWYDRIGECSTSGCS